MARELDIRRPTRRWRDPFALTPFSSGFSGDIWDPDRWFDDFSMGPSPLEMDVARPVAPACDIEETDTHYLLCLDMPGISKDEIRIDSTGNQLTVSGERRETKGTEATRFRTERYASFRRSFTLPVGADTNKIEANYRDGVLEIAIPKGEAGKARRIAIGEGTATQPKLAKVKERATEKAA